MKLHDVIVCDYFECTSSMPQTIGQVMLWEESECEERFNHKIMFRAQNSRLITAVVILKFPHVWCVEDDCGVLEFNEWSKEHNKHVLSKTAYSKVVE